jgi:hypothetical protein
MSYWGKWILENCIVQENDDLQIDLSKFGPFARFSATCIAEKLGVTIKSETDLL